MNRKVCFITGTRAEFGLLSRLMTLVQESTDCTLQIIATNMHLEEKYGYTLRDIENGGFTVDACVPMPRVDDSPESTLQSMAIELSGMSEALKELQPDLIVILGDRYEMLIAATAALMLHIPIAHIHGGEISEGAIDDTIRHCLTKMSHLHFTSTETYRKRVIQLGEQPDRVFNVGALGVENISAIPLVEKSELETELNIKFTPNTLLATYHPATLSNSSNEIKAFIKALNIVTEANFIFTLPNADPGSDDIRNAIIKWCNDNPGRGKYFSSLGIKRYLSALKYSAGVIGNSSSGIIEAPSAHIPTLDIGDRQRGRAHGESVFHSGSTDAQEIAAGIRHILSPEVRAIAKKASNPYDRPNTANRIFDIISTTDLHSLLQKKFYDTKILLE